MTDGSRGVVASYVGCELSCACPSSCDRSEAGRGERKKRVPNSETIFSKTGLASRIFLIVATNVSLLSGLAFSEGTPAVSRK